MKYRKQTIVMIISIIVLLMTSCLTMAYYPPKVAKPGKMYLGLGMHEEEGCVMFSGIFLRYGLPYGFDIGYNIQSILIFPYMLSINARKQFDINNDLINSITFDIGYGLSLGLKEYYTSISTIKNKFAFTVGYKRTIDSRFDGSTFSSYLRNEFLIKISKEYKYKRLNIMPILYYKAVKEYNFDSYVGLFGFPSPIDYIQRTGWSNKQIGIGISFYFDLF